MKRLLDHRSGLLAAMAAAALVLGSCSDTVTTVPVAEVEITPANASVQVGQSRALTARPLASSGEALTGRPVQWRSLHPEIADVDASGNVSGIAEGSATIEAASGGVAGTTSVLVTSGPVIALSATLVEFTAVRNGSSPGDRAISVTNDGTGSLGGLSTRIRYAAGEPTGWLTATLPATAPATMVLSVSQAGLVPGTYTASLDVESNAAANSPVVLTVRLTVADAPPAIALGATSLSFTAAAGGPVPSAQSVAVTNAGGGSLTGLTTSIAYTAGQPGGWLAATLSGTTAPTSIVVQAATASLPAGTYTATVSVAAAGAQNTPQQFAVTLTVGAALPAIQLSSTSLTFAAPQHGANPPPQTVQVTNAGGGSLTGLGVSVTFPGGQPSGWLTASLSATTAPATITLNAAQGALAPGSYSASVNVTSPVAGNSPRQIGVTLTVQPPAPTIVVTPPAATFATVATAGDPAPITLAVTNGGGGTLSGLSATVLYPAGGATNWLSAQLAGTTAPTSLTLTAQRGSLPVGTHTATVRLTSAQGAQLDVPVTWSIAAAAPVAPSGVSATAVSHQRIDVRWTDQSSDEEGFEVGRSTDGGNNWPITFNALPSSELFTDDGLTASTSYTYRVRACNAIGCSAWSALASATTAPLPPSNVAAAAVSATRIDVTWTNAGSGVTGNVLERSQDGSTWATRVTLAASATAFSDVEVAPGSGYHYRLRACRNGVCSGPSASAQATTPVTPPFAAPGAPGSLTATGVGSAIIDLAWSASSGLVSEYRIERSTGDQFAFSQVAVVGGTVTTWSDQGLSPGTTYFYRVRAANALGTSDWSPVASATTSATAPDVPGNLSVALITPSQVRVSWSAVTGVTHYQVRRSGSSGGWTVLAENVPAGTTEYLDTPGVAGTYRYSASACAGGLCSSWSSPSQQLTVTTP